MCRFLVRQESAERLAYSLYDEKFEGDFYVILWPRLMINMSEDGKETFIYLLKEKGVNVLFVPETLSRKDAYLHPRDGHPSVSEYRYVAEYLYLSLKKSHGSINNSVGKSN